MPKVTHKCVQIINEAIAQAGGPPNLIVTMAEPTLQKTMKLLQHPRISLVVATGGPGVVKAVMSSGKRPLVLEPNLRCWWTRLLT